MKPERVMEVLGDVMEDARAAGDDVRAAACREAAGYAGRWVSKKVAKPGDWDNAACPTCGASLSEHLGDGIYHHRTWMEYCPNDECHQKLEWDW